MTSMKELNSKLTYLSCLFHQKKKLAPKKKNKSKQLLIQGNSVYLVAHPPISFSHRSYLLMKQQRINASSNMQTYMHIYF